MIYYTGYIIAYSERICFVYDSISFDRKFIEYD